MTIDKYAFLKHNYSKYKLQSKQRKLVKKLILVVYIKNAIKNTFVARYVPTYVVYSILISKKFG